MRWRLLIAVVLLCAIVAGGLLCRREASACCDRISALLQPAVQMLAAGELPAPQVLEDALQQWERSLPLLSSLLHQDRLERVGQGLSGGLGYLRGGDAAGCMAQIDTALYLLQDIREYDDIRWQSLF